MPLLTETDALAIRDSFDTLPEDAKPLASGWMRRYKEQQDEFGVPLFPSEIEQATAARDELRGMFADLKTVDAGNGIYEQADRVKPGEGDRLRAREANMRFLSSRFATVPADVVRRDYPLYRDDYARKVGATPGLEDHAFYSVLKGEVEKERQAEELRNRALDSGFRAALEGKGSIEEFAKVSEQAGANTDNEVDVSSFLEAYAPTAAVLNKHRGLITGLADTVEADMKDGGKAKEIEALKEQLADLPGAERRLVLAALRIEADKRGKTNADEKGGKYSGAFWQQTGEAAFRIASDSQTDLARRESIISSVPESGEVLSFGPIKTAEDARRYVREAIAQETAFQLSAENAGPGGVGGMPAMDGRETITLDDKAADLIRDAKAREERKIRVDNEIRSIGGAIDPIPNVFASTIGTSGAALALMAGTRGLAAPALANAYRNIEYNDLSLKYPQMSGTDKMAVASISSAIQTAGDFVGVKALDKLPGIKSLISQPLTVTLAKRALGRIGITTATENVVEGVQDAATPLLMSALASDVPGYDWETEAKEWWKGRADVAVGLLPLTLLGMGAASVNEYRGAKALLSWNENLGAAGVVEADRVAIVDAAKDGRTEEAQGLLREAWGRRDKAVAAEYQDQMSVRQQEQAAASEELTRMSLLPDIRRDGSGYTVRTGETVATFATWDEARAVATEHMNDTERASAELVASIADTFMEGTPSFLPKGESFDIRQRGETLADRVRVGALTPEQAMEAAVAGGVVKGLSVVEARQIASGVFGGETKDERMAAIRAEVEKIVVLGRNTVEDGESKNRVNLQGNERAFLTVVEEAVEGRWKAGLSRRAFTKEQGLRWVELAEQATGESFLEGMTADEVRASGEASPRVLTEAISRIVVADVLGRMKNGQRVGAGQISRGLDLSDREQSALSAILDAFRRFFRAVLETASKLAKARQEGRLGGEYDALFDALTGGSSQIEHEAGAVNEAQKIADEVAGQVDTSWYSEETPGPNGETFSTSRAIPADSSKVVQMPDGARLVGPTTFSIRAYHGTPHKVDKFSTSKIGTGEGAQAYGWGLYFAENQGVAEMYAKQLQNKVDPRLAAERLWDRIVAERPGPNGTAYVAGGSFTKARFIKAFESGLLDAAFVTGTSAPDAYASNLYTVELLPDADEFLDWDKPVREQSAKVQTVFAGLWGGKANPSLTGRDVYLSLAMDLSGDQQGPAAMEKATKRLASLGIPGIRYLDGGSRGAGDGTRNYVIFDEKLVRILEENGKAVETFSIGSGDFAARVEAMFSPFMRTPEARLVMARVARDRALRLGGELIDKANVLRSAASIEREARFREADGADKRLNAYLDALTPDARQTLEWTPDELKDDPLVSAMLDHGKLMSKTTALKRDKLDMKMGDFDGAPWLPPSFYSSGAGIMPDQMAQAMFDAGLLKDAYADTLWEELGKRIESSRKDKAAHREAVGAYKDAQKSARVDARLEAEAWANQQRKEAGSPKAQRERIKGWLRLLDGILAAVPPEVRGRVGGYVKMAGIATDEAMMRELEARVDKLDEELSKWLKKEGTEQIERLFKKAAADYSAGKKAKGKIGPDEHRLFQAAEAAASMDAPTLRGELAKLDAIIDDESLSDEQRALAEMERGLLELVGDLKSADSGRVFSAFDALRDLYQRGALAWKTKSIAKREARKAIREALAKDTGKSGILPERQATEKEMNRLFGKLKSAWLSVSSFSEVLNYAFGGKSKQAAFLIDAEREASNTYEDEQQALAEELEVLFTGIAGGRVLDGERLRYDMAQRTIKAGDVELSQFEAIQALLMWRQEDGRRHMEGTFDENGERTSSWSYDQAWIDEVEKQITSEGRKVMAWIVAKYSTEHGELNTLYRERHGVNLPQHDSYAPITVKPMTAKAGEVVDPVSGSAVSGSILTPGSLRTRSRSAIAEPDFRDALQTLIGHKKQMGYWKAYYDLAVDAQAILGNRDLMNSVEAAAGKEAVNIIRRWVDVLAMGGTRDAAAGLALTGYLQRATNRAATVALLGRVSTLLVQSTQLAAASVQMPVGAYLVRFGKLLAGRLDWRGAVNSDFIQRRIQSAPPIVRQAMANIGTASRPNQITRAVRNLGNLLSGADGLFTGGTYAILLDYHRETGRAMGLSGADLEAHAHREAERATEQVAQPTRTATRSLAEITATHPLSKVGWAYSSEARQKIALLVWSASNAKVDPVKFAKTTFLVLGVGGLLSQVLKNIWREAKGDDDERKWSPERLTVSMLAGPLHGVPMASELMGEPGMLSSFIWAKPALGDILEGEGDLRDWNTILGAAGYFNDTAAGVAALSNAGLDFAKLLENAFSE